VNLSGTSLNDERFLEYLIAELTSRELVAGAMCFEITETAANRRSASKLLRLAIGRDISRRGCSPPHHFGITFGKLERG